MRRAVSHAFLGLAWASTSVTASPSAGCGKALPSGIYEMEDQHVTRSYRVFVPSGYRADTAQPLVLVFHGWGGDENEFLGEEPVTTLAERRGYLVVAPRGLGSHAPDSAKNSWTFRGSATGLAGTSGQRAGPIADKNTSTCDVPKTPDFTYPSCKRIARNACSWTQCQADDVTFVLALMGQLESTLCIDTDRIFASGGSNGGMFVWELGQNPASAGKFRAIAPLIGLPHRGYLDAPARPGGLPVLLITGAHDQTVPPGIWDNTRYTTSRDGGAYYYTGASPILRSWGPANGCPYSGTPAARFRTGTAEADCRTYCGDDARSHAGGWPKVLDCRAPMGHTYDLRWSWKLILDFFDAQASSDG